MAKVLNPRTAFNTVYKPHHSRILFTSELISVVAFVKVFS